MLKNDYLFTHESENGEYGNEQAFQSKGRAGYEILRLVKRLYRISAGVLNGAQNGTWNIVITI